VRVTTQSPEAPQKAAIGRCCWLALFILSSTAAIALGQLVWDGPSVVVCAGLGMVSHAISRWLRVRTSQPIPGTRTLANRSTFIRRAFEKGAQDLRVRSGCRALQFCCKYCPCHSHTTAMRPGRGVLRNSWIFKRLKHDSHATAAPPVWQTMRT
jgi:hypothetical protein